ncbi:MAG: hypothetical protein U0797_13495 [Gemmataceae bacterium]
MSEQKRFLTALAVACLSLAGARAADDLDNVRDRQKVEAQRLEKEFADDRLAAYKLVRRDDPKLGEASEKLRTLMELVRNDTALDPQRRDVLLVTLKADLDRVRLIANDRERFSARRDEAIVSRGLASASPGAGEAVRVESSRRVTDDARSVIESRARSVTEARADRVRNGDRFNRAMASVADSAVPESRPYTLPKNWAELSRKRSTATKMTAKERGILKALGTTISVEFEKNSLEDVIGFLKRVTDVEILVDRRALEEASVSYETPLTLKAKLSMRTVLKRLLGDLNLTYVIKDEAIQITSRERAKEMTTVRAYYIGDLALLTDYTVPFGLSQLAMMEQVNRIITMVTSNVDQQSWKANNPDAVGVITFDPITMTLVVKQTAEVHYLLGGGLP